MPSPISSVRAAPIIGIADQINVRVLDTLSRFADGRDVRLFIITLGAFGNLVVDWSALASVANVLSLSKFVILLFYYLLLRQAEIIHT